MSTPQANRWEQPQSPAAWYALRRTLPPWRFDELVDEMIRELPGQGVDEVIVMVDTEEFSHGFPSLEWIRDHQARLVRARDALRVVNIVYSLNPWVTQGHASRGRRMDPAMRPVVGADGAAQSCIACPLSEGWRTYQSEAWTLYAETEPAVIWIEDDIRTFGDHFCVCPQHLERFSGRVGRIVDRHELLEALLQAGEPHPWRVEFLRMQDGIMREAAGNLAAAVHDASPRTRIGLMSSGPRNHVQEGRDWNRLAEALEPTGVPLFSRPTMGNYWEWDLRGLYFSQDSIKITRRALPPGALDMTEVEAVPFSRTSNSVTFLAAKLALSFAYGARGVTLNIFDHLGSAMGETPEYGKLLAAMKPRLNTLAAEAQRPGKYRGIRLFHFDSAAETARLQNGAVLSSLRGEGEGVMQAFEAAGVPTTYDEDNVAALTGNQAWALADGELLELLSRGLFLDGAAAFVLCERGFGHLIGLEATALPRLLSEHGAISAEEYLHPDFGGAPRRYLSALLPNADYRARLGILQPAPGAMVISRFVDPDTNPLMPAMTAFENADGGRVIVHAWDYASSIGAGFYGPHRTRQLQVVANWLAMDGAPVMAGGDGAWPLAFRKDCGDVTLVGLTQLSLDSWPGGNLSLHVEMNSEKVEYLTDHGTWDGEPAVSTCVDGKLDIHFDDPIAYGQWVVARIHWKSKPH